MKVGIAGAGIGGLSLALMLHRRGIEVEIWEAVQNLRPLGVGINLLPHATKELTELGLATKLSELGVETSSLAYYNKLGQQIWKEPRGIAGGYPWPQYSVHRGEFQMLLLGEVEAQLGGHVVHKGLRAMSYAQEGEQVTVSLRAQDGSLHSRTVDVLVAADGIRSQLRQQNRHAAGDPFRYSGRVLWRGAVECDAFLDGRSMFMAGHPDQKFVAYPISEQARRRGRSLVNWIAELRVPQPGEEDWNRLADKRVFQDAFASWNWGWIDIPALIEKTELVYEFPLVDKDPLGRWSYGRMTHLGDAAHPLYPIGSNGAAQAILDARCLADCLARQSDAQLALREYEADRLPKTAAIALRNRLHGPEQVMELAELRAPQGFTDIERVIPRTELEAIALRYKQLAGFDLQSLQGAAAPARHGGPA
jgi:2-polyprenyl-6-methoxyphenol hydroxylase-like FAD-dependent oxidoreductase